MKKKKLLSFVFVQNLTPGQVIFACNAYCMQYVKNNNNLLSAYVVN